LGLGCVERGSTALQPAFDESEMSRSGKAAAHLTCWKHFPSR
jgi:hypothetical protein